MKNGKLSLDEMSKKAEKLSKEEQLKMLGGRRGRGGINSWSTSRGGLIEDDIIIRFNQPGLVKGGL
jgi:hypothetical protein